MNFNDLLSILWIIAVGFIIYKLLKRAFSEAVMTLVKPIVLLLTIIEMFFAANVIIATVIIPFNQFLHIEDRPIIAMIITILGGIWLSGVLLLVIKDPGKHKWLYYLANGLLIGGNTALFRKLILHFYEVNTMGWHFVIWLAAGMLAIAFWHIMQDEMLNIPL